VSVIHAAGAAEAERLCEEGYACLEAGRFDEANCLLGRALSLAPTDPRIHYRLGLLYFDTGRPGEALNALDASLALQPNNARAHNNRGSALQQVGRFAEAEQAFKRALELDLDLAPAYANLGKLLEQQGKPQEAVAIYERAIGRGLDAAVFGHNLAAASGQLAQRAPDPWVRATFDNFAPTFDTHLRALEYDAPHRLATMLRARCMGRLDILDLGCGTGLCGLSFAEQKGHLIGIDLSEKMLARAHARGLYDELHLGEAHAWIRGCAAASFDLVIAADVLVYVGAIEELFRGVVQVLRPRGWFAFSTEEREDADYTLLPTGRFAHSQTYINRLAGTAFAVIDANAVVVRLESGTPVAGRLYLLQKTSTG
jgi:predicted TPR repeat methyltransferase